MMIGDKYITRQAIKDANNRILGYEIVYSDKKGDACPNEECQAQIIYDCLAQNLEKTFENCRIFMTFTSSLLAKKTPHLFENTDLIIQVDDSVIIHPASIGLIEQYIDKGYEIAANDFQFAPRYIALLEKLSYIKINLKTLNIDAAKNIINIANDMHKKVIATGIDTKELLILASELGVYGMQGSYITYKLANKPHECLYLRSNFFKLIIALNREEPDINEIEQIISADTILSYGILKIVNSSFFANRLKTQSIKQAILTIGLNQLRRFVYLLSIGDNENVQDFEEFIKLSFMRANFMSELYNYISACGITKSEAYMIGMFSTLEYLIDADIKDIVSAIELEGQLKNAIISGAGKSGQLLNLIISYEKADWKNVSDYAEHLGIPYDTLTTTYFKCIKIVNELWNGIVNY